ncbi:hypothetical protein VdG1_01028 [Verticillium dahliae VDG1]|nr:hypothetical protein VdG1_01028 [Verticillium dahliae VDG1]KAG7100452.1 hypothetical protein HYQ44_019804 [Verticillium longisporum]
MLRSPAEPFIKGRGVESVRSPVRNVGVGNEEFEGAVVREFGAMYGAFDVIAEVNEDAAELESVRKGMKELQSRDWLYGQTPLFSFSTRPTEDDPRPRPALPDDFNLSFEARQGVLQSFVLGSTSPAGEKWSVASLADAKIHDVDDWVERLRGGGVNSDRASAIGSWLNGLLGAGGGR